MPSAIKSVSLVRTHTERITRSPHTFELKIDADDIRPFSKRSIVDDVMQSVAIEGPAVNPRLRVEGMPDLHSIDAMIASIIKPGMTDQEKLLAIHATISRFSLYTSPPSRSSDTVAGSGMAASWMPSAMWSASRDTPLAFG